MGLLGSNEELGVSLLPSRIDRVEGAAAKTLSGPDGHLAGEAGDRELRALRCAHWQHPAPSSWLAAARSVTIVTRGEMFRARRSYVSRVADDERFSLRWASEIVEVLGDKGVEGVRVRDNEAGSEEVVACSGLFVGLVPNAGLLSPDGARDERRLVVTDASFETAASGVFAVGAVRSGYGGRLTQAVAEATTAAERAAARCED